MHLSYPLLTMIAYFNFFSEVCEDDIEIVRLALLWTLLLHDERLTAFLAFADANDIYVRLAEVLLVGTFSSLKRKLQLRSYCFHVQNIFCFGN